MEIQKIIEVCNDAENKSNKDLQTASDFLYTEFNKTKELIIDLTRHLESLETHYNILQKELKKRHNL